MLVTSATAGNDGMFDPDGPAAAEIAGLWWLLFWLGVLAFVAFAVSLGIALWRRRSANRDRETGSASLRRIVLGGGLVFPAIVLTVVLVATVRTMRALSDSAPDDAVRVEVVGHRWWWEIRYPDSGVVSANELHMPVGRAVEVSLTSADVIHGLWVPALGGKLDLLPDRTNVMVLQADEPGEHRTQCAEFCGMQHALMRLLVVVHPDGGFESWVERNAQDAAVASDPGFEVARRLFAEAGCASCHTVRGTDANGATGPDLTHVASREMIGAGATAWTRENALAWISEPQDLTPGIDMPAWTRSDEELETLLDYLMGLR